MELNKWENKSYKKLCKMFDNFYEMLAKEGEKCFKKDSKEIFNADTKDLSIEEKNRINNYWNKYLRNINLNYHKYYIDKTHQFDERFIPDDVFVRYIDGYLNNRVAEPGVADKNYFDMYFQGLKMPKTYLRLVNGQYLDKDYNLVTPQKAYNILSKLEQFIVKPSIASYGGKNIHFYYKNNQVDLKCFLNSLNMDNAIFQEILSQSNETAKPHPQSLNTIRIMTLLLDNEIKILPAAFRMGIDDTKVDNASSGGIYCAINTDGTLSSYAYNALGKRYTRHPNGGNFNEVKIKFMPEIKKMVKIGASRLPQFRLIGWDIAIDKDNKPTIIEANLTMSGLDVIQTICGPVFGDYTSIVLNEVFANKKNKERRMDISQYV